MISSSQTERLQDEIYRQMLRLEAGCSCADFNLALALLQAWMVLERDSSRTRTRKWLRALCPLCLHMIQAQAGACTSDAEESAMVHAKAFSELLYPDAKRPSRRNHQGAATIRGAREDAATQKKP
jgi:hypothetical protein